MPYYKLEDVRISARNNKIEYRSRKVKRDIDNLGYDFMDVINCLMSLIESDFHKTYYYENGDIDDAYRIDYPSPIDNDENDSLYIKFCLINNYLMIDLASFHQNY
ncbi:MAG: type II toxin-antitoxin system MqsR family toxin [Candidatus Marithrix sp.]